MWSAVVGWVGSLLTLAVVFALLDLLQPEGSLKGAVRTVMGLAMVAAVLGPAVGLVEDSAAWSALLQRWDRTPEPSPVPAAAVDAGALHQTLWQEVLTAGEARLRAQVEQVLAREGLRLAELGWSSAPDGGRLRVRVEGRAMLGLSPDRLRRELARALELDPGQVEIGPAGTVVPGASGAPAGSGGPGDPEQLPGATDGSSRPTREEG